MHDARLETVAARLRAASSITILTGAGVSAASGVPTFRGAGGLWGSFRPEELATPEAFRRDPRLVWEWYASRRATIAACRPNAAHEVIARWSHPSTHDRHQSGPDVGVGAAEAGRSLPPGTVQRVAGETGRRVSVITQNVDDLHVRAGTRDLVRLHGSIWELRCTRCGAAWRDERVPLPEIPPACAACAGLARPAVVWFGEPLNEDDLGAALRACDCEVFLTVGTSAVVYPAAGFVHEASGRGAFTVEINAEATPASAAADMALHGPAEVLLPRLDEWLTA